MKILRTAVQTRNLHLLNHFLWFKNDHILSFCSRFYLHWMIVFLPIRYRDGVNIFALGYWSFIIKKGIQQTCRNAFQDVGKIIQTQYWAISFKLSAVKVIIKPQDRFKGNPDEYCFHQSNSEVICFFSFALGPALEKAFYQVKLELFCSNSFKVQFLSVTVCSYLM